jgi:hypothetical protein
MKSGKIAVALALLLSPILARAEGKFAIGPQGGLTFPNFKVNNDSTLSGLYGNRSGWLGGIFLEFGVWSIVIRPEANYVQKGYSVGSVNVDNHYIELPALVKINPLGSLPVSPFIVLGPQWSKQVGDSVSYGNTTVFTNTNDRWDISAVGGVGIDINFSERFAFELQGRYSYGFRNVSNTTTEVKMRDFYAIAGLSIQSPF